MGCETGEGKSAFEEFSMRLGEMHLGITSIQHGLLVAEWWNLRGVAAACGGQGVSRYPWSSGAPEDSRRSAGLFQELYVVQKLHIT